MKWMDRTRRPHQVVRSSGFLRTQEKRWRVCKQRAVVPVSSCAWGNLLLVAVNKTSFVGDLPRLTGRVILVFERLNCTSSVLNHEMHPPVMYPLMWLSPQPPIARIKFVPGHNLQEYNDVLYGDGKPGAGVRFQSATASDSKKSKREKRAPCIWHHLPLKTLLQRLATHVVYIQLHSFIHHPSREAAEQRGSLAAQCSLPSWRGDHRFA